MKYANEALFLVFVLVLAGLFISSIPYVARRTSSNTNNYWLIALGLNISAFLLFALGTTVDPILLTFANSFFFAGYFYLFIFCRALNDKPVKKLVSLSPLLFLAFGSVFECMRQFGVFQDRVVFIISFLICCLIGMLIELFQVSKRERNVQINFLIFTCFAEIVLGVVRVWMLLENTLISTSTIYTEPLITTMIRWFAVAFTVLSYISINGFMAEKLAQTNAANLEDSERVVKLLRERDSMIATLLKANKSSSTEALSASIAHELNQPLGATLLNIQFLKTLHESDQLEHELVGTVIKQLEKDTKRSGEIIHSLRTIFGKDSGVKEFIQVREVVDNALTIYKSEFILKNIQIKIDLTHASVFFYRGQFLQVLLNLINNSIQILSISTPAQKLISLRGYYDQSQYHLEISDTGPGVALDLQSKLFELFSSNKSSGMGVGLWLCAYIMRNAGGKITYQDAPGGGAKFMLSFPMTPEKI